MSDELVTMLGNVRCEGIEEMCRKAADRIAALTKERDEAREWLGAANNEFGSAAWDWPDLWRRIAQLKEISNERWTRANERADRIEALEAENAALSEACAKWAEVSQGNYQRAKDAEAERDGLRAALAKADALAVKVDVWADHDGDYGYHEVAGRLIDALAAYREARKPTT